MFVHSVYFWLKEGLSTAAIESFRAGVVSLRGIETVRQSFVGSPAETDRPVIDRSYSYALIVVFDDQAGHDIYQEHEIHERFRQECSAFWSKVLIYDSVM